MTVVEANRSPPERAGLRALQSGILPAAIAGLLAILVLTWLGDHSLNTRAESYDRELGELEHFGLIEAALERDALASRAGLLRSYDPLVLEVSGLEAELALLKTSAGGEASAALARLTATVRGQEAEIERLKSANALLQNSLAHFERLSARTDQRAGDAALMPQVRRLAASVLHLTLDTSAGTVQEVKGRLDDLARVAARSPDDEVIRGLLAHGRLLDRVLPSTDEALRALRTAPELREREALRAVVLRQQRASRASARASRLILYVVSLALVALLIRLGLELRSRAEALRRRAAFEHVIATLSMRFVKAPVRQTSVEIRRALAQMAECVGADRAYFVASAPQATSHVWSQAGVGFPAGWPALAAELAGRLAHERGGVVHIPDVARWPSPSDRRLLAAQQLKGWTCAATVSEDGAQVVLGFDALRHPCRITWEGELSLLGMALDAILNAVRREQMDAQRARLQARLQQARRMEAVGALASGIAHNFNNIIGAIVGHAEMAEMEAAGDGGGARSLEEIRRAGERARELVEQILTFGARREQRRQPVSLADCVTEASCLLRGSLPRGIDLCIANLPHDAVVMAEPVQLQQVILNLCANAAHAMDGAGRIELAVSLHDHPRERILSHGSLPPGSYVSLTVRDAGRGMDESTLARIFEPFFTTRPGGKGLGLATVREIVCECEGAMDVQSAEGAGTTFEVWLPRLAHAVAIPADPAGAGALGSGETVLVIDDNRAQLLRSEEILAALGYEPVGFSGPERALQREPPLDFDAAVIGHVQVAGGLAIAARVHERVPGLPVVLATAAVEAATADALMAHPVREIIRRPLVTGEVAAALNRSLTPWRGMTGVPRELS